MNKTPTCPRDPNQLAKFIVDVTMGEIPPKVETPSGARAKKAGAVGGPARAKALSPLSDQKSPALRQKRVGKRRLGRFSYHQYRWRFQLHHVTRLTNGFSKKVENHAYAVAPHMMYYNFVQPRYSFRPEEFEFWQRTLCGSPKSRQIKSQSRTSP